MPRARWQHAAGRGRGHSRNPDPHTGHSSTRLLPLPAGHSPSARRHAPGTPTGSAQPAPSGWIALAASLAAGLARDPERSLVHTDIHYDNILASERPTERWVVIDPKAAAGTPARSAAELLWTRVDELPGPQAITSLLDTIIDNGQLDRAKATAWGFVRSIDYWLWGLENGLTTDPLRCQRVASALAPIAR